MRVPLVLRFCWPLGFFFFARSGRSGVPAREKQRPTNHHQHDQPSPTPHRLLCTASFSAGLHRRARAAFTQPNSSQLVVMTRQQPKTAHERTPHSAERPRLPRRNQGMSRPRRAAISPSRLCRVITGSSQQTAKSECRTQQRRHRDRSRQRTANHEWGSHRRRRRVLRFAADEGQRH
jgi:hypothetical protein